MKSAELDGISDYKHTHLHLHYCLETFCEYIVMVAVLVNSLLQSACEQCNMESLITAFLLVRQACLEGQHVFLSYQQWFAVSTICHECH